MRAISAALITYYIAGSTRDLVEGILIKKLYLFISWGVHRDGGAPLSHEVFVDAEYSNILTCTLPERYFALEHNTVDRV